MCREAIFQGPRVIAKPPLNAATAGQREGRAGRIPELFVEANRPVVVVEGRSRLGQFLVGVSDPCERVGERRPIAQRQRQTLGFQAVGQALAVVTAVEMSRAERARELELQLLTGDRLEKLERLRTPGHGPGGIRLALPCRELDQELEPLAAGGPRQPLLKLLRLRLC